MPEHTQHPAPGPGSERPVGKPKVKASDYADPPPPEPVRLEARPFTWLDPGTWSNSIKFFPAYVVLVAIFIAVYYNHFTDPTIDLSSFETCTGSFNYSFRINAAMTQAHRHSVRSWEIGYAYEATQQIYNPERSVLGPDPFPGGKVPKLGLRLDEASLYIEPKLKTDGKSWRGSCAAVA